MNDITELALLVSKAKASVFTLEYISQFEPDDIDSDDVDLRFEVDGRDTGTNVSIVDECGQAAKVIGALVEALEKAQSINAAAEKLVRCKGRYHSEQNYRALAALFGVTTPDLPPLDSESRTVTVKLPEVRITIAEAKLRNLTHQQHDAYNAGASRAVAKISQELTAQGIKWEAE
ncbi:ead/Ea22-like family protein [Klebsiella aerogenes]